MRDLAHMLLFSAALALVASAQTELVRSHDGPAAWTKFGTAVASAGDVDGDFHQDVIIAAPYDDVGSVNSGSIEIRSGQDGSLLHSMHGATALALFGFSVDGVGDLNADGHDDFIVGAPSGENAAGEYVGLVRVHSGLDGTLLHLFLGVAEGDNFGVAVSAAGDVDGDGTPDLIVGANGTDLYGEHSGSAIVFSGASGVAIHSFHGLATDDNFGRSVAGAGDLNGDGHADLIVGAPQSDGNGLDSGSVRAFSGADGSLLWTASGNSAGDHFGHALDGAGDVDGDGFDDIVVGAYRDDPNGIDSGCAWVLSGFDGSIIHTLTGVNAGDEFGISVRTAGDVNGDDVADIVVGARRGTHGIRSGTATVFDGVTGGLLKVFGGDWWADDFGYSVAGVGDLSGDGFGDVVVGAPHNDGNGLAAGRVKILAMPTMPVLKFRSQLPAPHRLDASWVPDGGDLHALTATIVCEQATPGGNGAYGVSLTRIDYPMINGVPLMIVLDSTNLVEAGMFAFDATGTFTAPSVTRQFPAAAGELVHVQFFETWPVISSSPGIRLLLAP